MAVLLSFIVHSILLLVLAFIILDRPAGSAGGGGEIELAIVTQTELTQLQSQAIESTLPEMAADAAPEMFDAALFDTPVTELGMEAAVQNVASLGGVGQSLEGGLDLGSGSVGGAASFFGVEARGTRFAYIVDISGSMTGSKLETMRRELAGSLEALNEHASFAVVLFSHDSHIIGGRRQWSRAIRRIKDSAVRDINAISASGATQPLPAFEIVFGLRPRPDAIYFMTDGMFAESVVQEVARMNSSWIEPTPIHTISFVSREAESQLRRIAEKSGGVYTHVPGPGQ